MDHRAQNDVAVFNAGVVALQINRAGTVHLRPEGASGGAENGLVVDDLDAVEDHGGVALDESDIERLPLAGRLLGVDGGFEATVNGAHVVRVKRLAKTVKDLHFVDAAQVDAAVAFLRQARFGVQREVLKLRDGAEIAVILFRFAFFLGLVVGENAVMNAPAVGRVGFDKAPAVQALAVEQRHGVAEFDAAQVGRGRHGRETFAGEFGAVLAVAFGLGHDAEELKRIAVPRHSDGFGQFDFGGSAIGPFAVNTLNACEHEFVPVEMRAIEFEDTAPAPKHLSVDAVAVRLDTEPAGAAAGNGQAPLAEKGIIGGVAWRGMEHAKQTEEKRLV
jgi:hypothetical protein